MGFFGRKPTLELPPIGRLTWRRGHWEARVPPPPIDSTGRLSFVAGRIGPTKAQVSAFFDFARVYPTHFGAISEAIFNRYETDLHNDLPVSSAEAVASATRLVRLWVYEDLTLELGYESYFYYGDHLERVDGQYNVIFQEGHVRDVMFES